MMLSEVPCNVNFFDWFDSLSDDEREATLVQLRQVAADLGVRVDIKPFITQDTLNFPPHILSQLFAN